MSWLRTTLGRRGTAVAVLVGCLALGAAAGAVGLALQPDVSGTLGPGEVTVDVGVRASRTSVDVPPLGRLVADSHRGPLGVEVRVDRVDLERVGALASDLAQPSDAARRLRGDIDDDLAPLLRALGVRTVAVAALAGVAAGLLLPRRRVRYVAATTAGSLAFVAVAGGLAFSSFSPRAFDAPRFEGSLAAAPDIVNTVQRHLADVSVVESRLEALSLRLGTLYQAMDTGSPAADAVTILHVSDLHSNPVGIELVDRTADRFDVDAILDTGDVTSFGVSLEELTVRRVARFRTPYYVVPGNHDHPRIRSSLRLAGVEVLDPGVTTIAGIRVLGVGDPSYTADNQVDDARYEGAIARSADSVRRRARIAEPDLVAVHNPRQLDASFGEVPVGVAGHQHRFDLRYEDGTVVSVVGSAGATGVGSLAEEEDLPYQMQLLQFEDRRLVAIDRLSFEGLDGEFRLERQLIDPNEVAAYPNRRAARLDASALDQLLRPDRPG